MKNYKIGIYIFLIALIFGIAETIYFGMNMFPESKAERICDVIVLLMVLVGIIISKKSK